MVWNLLGESKVRANNVMLPEMSIKPYVQYGIGVQKICKDRFTAYGQAMITNGGRNGVSLTGGFRWALGKEGKPIEKVQTKQKNNKTIKSSTKNSSRCKTTKHNKNNKCWCIKTIIINCIWGIIHKQKPEIKFLAFTLL